MGPLRVQHIVDQYSPRGFNRECGGDADASAFSICGSTVCRWAPRPIVLRALLTGAPGHVWAPRALKGLASCRRSYSEPWEANTGEKKSAAITPSSHQMFLMPTTLHRGSLPFTPISTHMAVRSSFLVSTSAPFWWSARAHIKRNMLSIQSSHLDFSINYVPCCPATCLWQFSNLLWLIRWQKPIDFHTAIRAVQARIRQTCLTQTSDCNFQPGNNYDQCSKQNAESEWLRAYC